MTPLLRTILSSVLSCIASVPTVASAGGLFADGFDPPVIAPLFPEDENGFVLPDGPTVVQLEWLMAELAAGETTTIAEIEAHFDATWLAQVSAEQTQSFIASIRSSHPDARITDVVTVTPVRATLVIDTPGSALPSGFLTIGARYAGARRIVQLGVSNYGGTVQLPDDRALDMNQAAARFATLSTSPALLVGRIGADGQCSAMVDLDAAQLRATASIFKIWVLGAVGRSIRDGTLSADETVPMVASEIAPGGTINVEPLGTPFTAGELATLMMGISDNTATDLLHERVGRDAIDAAIDAFGVALPEVLQPLLGISEQFHLLHSFPLEDSLAYVNGSEAFQQQFLVDEIEPLGPLAGGPYFHQQLLTQGTWRASPLDVCRAFANLRRLPPGSEALATVDAALGASAAQPDVRGDWERVWYKGGSLASGNGLHVLTHAWMLENAGEAPHVVVAMANSAGGQIDAVAIQSVTGRLLQLVSELP